MTNRTPPDFLSSDMADLSGHAADWFETLRDRICGQFEAIERDAGSTPLSDRPAGTFQRRSWNRDGGGGGRSDEGGSESGDDHGGGGSGDGGGDAATGGGGEVLSIYLLT